MLLNGDICLHIMSEIYMNAHKYTHTQIGTHSRIFVYTRIHKNARKRTHTFTHIQHLIEFHLNPVTKNMSFFTNS